MKAAIYARESSADTTKAPPIGEQIKRALVWIEEQGYELTTTYEDNGRSGGDWNRPQFNQAVRDAKANRYKILVVWAQDRIARDTEQFLRFYRTLSKAHVEVYSLVEGAINMETAGDRIKHTSMAMAHETFRLITSEKVKRTYAAKKKKAEETGKPLVWGRKAIDLDLKLLQKLRSGGLGWRGIAKEYCKQTGLMVNYNTVRRAILGKNET